MIIIDNGKCTQCEECIKDCHNGALEMIDDTLTHNPDKCNACGHCLAVCPTDSIMIDGDGYDCMDVEDFGFFKHATAAQVRALIMMRRSVRNFTDEEVSEENIETILEAGKYAPTGKNAQGNAFLVIKSPEAKDNILAETADIIEKKGKAVIDKIPGLGAFFLVRARQFKEEGKDEFFYGAPVIIYVFADNDIDGAVCATNMGFMAQGLGLGYCFAQLPCDAFEDPEMRARWNVPEGKKCVLSLLIGHPEPQYFSSVPRKTPEVIIK